MFSPIDNFQIVVKHLELEMVVHECIYTNDWVQFGNQYSCLEQWKQGESLLLHHRESATKSTFPMWHRNYNLLCIRIKEKEDDSYDYYDECVDYPIIVLKIHANVCNLKLLLRKQHKREFVSPIQNYSRMKNTPTFKQTNAIYTKLTTFLLFLLFLIVIGKINLNCILLNRKSVTNSR